MLNDYGNKIIDYKTLQRKLGLDNYSEFCKKVEELVIKHILIEVKSSGLNGMNPPLFNRYKIFKNQPDIKYLTEEINQTFPIQFGRNFYLNNLGRYLEEQEYVKQLISYYRNNSNLLSEPMSINERSFQIFGKEKFLKTNKILLKHLSLDFDFLNVYLSPEPFVYYSRHKQENQNVLIIENKDTWYTIRKLMIGGQSYFLGVQIDTIIYGCGKKIESSLDDYYDTVEPYLYNAKTFYYWGDIDFEGISIYERLFNKFPVFNIQLYKPAYLLMLKLSENFNLPFTRELQNRNIETVFLKQFDYDVKKILENDKYIPQEIITYHHLKQ